MDYKLKLIEAIEQAIEQMDKLETPEDRAAAAIWFSDFALEAGAGLVAYAALKPDMRPVVRKGLVDKHNKIRSFLKGAR